jgi:hypothetical protein
VFNRQQTAGKRSRLRRRQHRALGVGVGGVVLAWGAATAAGAPTAHADVLDAVIDPVISAAAAAISPLVESAAGIGTTLATDSSAALDLGSLAGSLFDVTHLAALPVEATGAAAVDPLAASSAVSAASLDELLNQFLQQSGQEWMASPLGSAIDEQWINPIGMMLTGHDLIATNAAGSLGDTAGTAADPDHASVALTPVPDTVTVPGISGSGLSGIEGQVTISVNGGPETSALVDTGSAGLLIPIQDVGLQNLGLPLGFESLTYGTAELNQNIIAAEFTAPIDFGDGIVTHPTEIAVPLFTTVHETFELGTPIDLGPFGTIDSIPITIGFPDIPPFTDTVNVEPILGIGAAGVLPSNPVTEALPGELSQGVLINVPGHTLEFGPNPLDASTTLDGNPLTTVQVQIGDGPLTTVTAAFDSGGQYGSVPASLLSASEITPVTVSSGSLSLTVANEVTPGTVISVYTPDGELLYQTTTTADTAPTVTNSGDLFNTGLTPFLNHPIFIGYGPNDGSPGMTGFTPNTGFTVFDN